MHPLFKTLFDYVKSHDLTEVAPGRITIDGERLYINVCDATLCDENTEKLEVHRKYIDVHFPLDNEEIVGWCDLKSITVDSDAPFDEANDFALYHESASTYFVAHPGDFYIMFPEDAHAPLCGEGTLRKAIAKVLL